MFAVPRALRTLANRYLPQIAISLLFKENDIEGDHSRSMIRYRRVIMGGGMAVIAKSITALTSIITIPFAVRYLGPERFGMWMTINSLMMLISFADLGIGNGLVSAVAYRDGLGDREGTRRIVSTAAYTLLGIGLAIMMLFGVANFFVDWHHTFSVSSPLAIQESGPATFAFVACFCANLPLTISQRVQMAVQASWLANLWVSLGNILGLIFVLVGIAAHAGVPILTLGICGGPVIANLIGTAVEFIVRRPDLLPRLSQWSSDLLPGLFGTGFTFFLLQIMAVLGLGGIDNLIISAVSGASAVGPYAVMLRFAQLTLIVAVFLQPLWPALGEALGRGDYAWARSALTRASKLTLAVGGSIAIITVLFGATIVRLWTGLFIPDGMKFGFAAFTIVSSYGGVVAAFMNNEGLVRRQLGIFAAATLLCLILKFVFMQAWGTSGLVWAMPLAYGSVFCLFGVRMAYKILDDGIRMRANSDVTACVLRGTESRE